jgi:hypothetical protein
MLASPAADPVLKRFRAALDTLYGDRIERVVLFGSRARGDAREDYDVAVFLVTPEAKEHCDKARQCIGQRVSFRLAGQDRDNRGGMTNTTHCRRVRPH